jgi:hypothetical protein
MRRTGLHFYNPNCLIDRDTIRIDKLTTEEIDMEIKKQKSIGRTEFKYVWTETEKEG